MLRSARRLALLAIAFVAAHAQAMTIDFTGIVTGADAYNIAGPATGETITGLVAYGSFAGATPDGFFWGTFTPTAFTISAVPEVANLALMLAGLGVVGAARRRTRQAAGC